jgi:hypothetical protein
MAKIENTTVYPLTTPSADDFIIGTDTSDDNRTVSFSISTLTATGGLQGLQSVLDTGAIATQNINLTGNITVVGTVEPTTITASASTGAAGQVLSSTGTGLQWIAAASVSCCSLDDTLTVGNTTAQDINTTGNVAMSGAGTSLAFTGGSDITLAAASSITTEDDIILGSASVLNLNATSVINDATGAVGSTGQILTVNAALGVEWSTGVPAASMPTLQEVLTAGNTATAIGMALSGVSNTTFSVDSAIQSAGTNVFSGNNTFSANGTTTALAGVNLTGSFSDGVGTGTTDQVLTSTVTGVQWKDVSAVGVSSVEAAPPSLATVALTPITVTPITGAVEVIQKIYNGGPFIGCVPGSGTAGTFLEGNGNWATPTGAVTSVSVLASATSTGPTDAIKISPTTGAVQVQSNAFGGGDAVGHVPDATGNTAKFLKGDGTWAAGSAAAPEWVQTIGVGTVKVTMTGGDYYMSGIAGAAGVESNTSNWNSNLSTSPPSTAPPSDGQHAMSMVYANNSVTGCTTSYPNHTLCDAIIMVSAGYSDTFFVTLWKGPLASHSIYQAVPAATWTEAITATNINVTKNMTIATSGTEILEPGFGFFATVRAATGGVQGTWVARIVLKFSGSV